MHIEAKGKRADFYEQYRRARFLRSASSLYSTSKGVVAPGGTMLFDGLEKVLSPEVYYAIMNKHKNTIYQISEYRWAVKNNHKF